MCADRRKEVRRWLSESELDERLKTAEGELLRRFIFIKNLYCGDTIAVAADRVGRSESTGDRWAATWNDGGPEALAPNHGGGRPAKLDDSERDRLTALLRDGQPWQSTAIRQLLDEEFDVTFHPNYVPAFLRELGLEYAPGTGVNDDAGSERSGGWVFE